ncbi:MAG TPA: hypothetical protein VMX74_11390 [Pirellulales bacterium]|nr:hypothetical protein [Pirellulales bacterium]
MAEPIKPHEVVEAKKNAMPSEVIECFNELIAEKWNGRSATIKQSEAANRIAKRMNVDTQYLYASGFMDVEDVFRDVGWKVTYDKPGYNETYTATFEFRK